MTHGADLHVDLLLRGHRVDAVSACANDGRRHVLGVNSVLHVPLRVLNDERAARARVQTGEYREGRNRVQAGGGA